MWTFILNCFFNAIEQKKNCLNKWRKYEKRSLSRDDWDDS